MLEFTDLQVLWWMIIGSVLIVYATTAGFDFGATMIMPFLRQEEERRVVLNVVGRTWDGNQTWIVFAGGALFVIWPVVYGATFSGLYAAMLCVLWSFFLRPPGFDYRSKIDSPVWRRCWDIGLFISSFLPMFVFGVAFGNLLQGLPIHFDPIDLRSYYDGNFFDLFNPMGLLCGVVSIVMSVMHGASLLHRRTTDALRFKMRRIFISTNIILIVLCSMVGWATMFLLRGYTLVHSPIDPTVHPLSNVVTLSIGAWFKSFSMYPWKWIPLVLTYVALFIGLVSMLFEKKQLAFWASVVVVGGIVATAGCTLFPFIVPSSVASAQSLTVWNATSAQYTLNIMLIVASILLTIILIYKLFAYWAVWRGRKTLSVEDIKQDSHGFY